MFRKFGLPVLALIGIAFSIFMIFWSRHTPPVPPILFHPPKSPYKHYIAGEGTIESFNENINIGTSFPDLIWDIFVKTGDQVKKGMPLFKLDTRQQEADLQKAIQEFKVAKTVYENQKIQFQYYRNLKDKSAVSQQQYTQALYAMKQALEQVKVTLANIISIKTFITRSTIIAPIDGKVLQSNARLGEFANVNPFNQTSLMIFGDTRTYQLRVNVAEEDAWRVIKGSPATAFVRGNSGIQIPLSFSYIEPYIIPKQQLTGSDIERIDTRVLQIIYTFNPQDLPIYIGQLLDVYLEAKPSKES